MEKLFLTSDRAAIYLILTGTLMLLVIWTHRSNVRRIVAGTENRFSLSRHGKSA
jgi:glycerol-3-phosphate acyltransferase PlsY